MKRKLDDEAAAQRESIVDDLKEELQRILKERKAESKRLAEMKRLEGLRKIQERNDFQPLERFPLELWLFILDEMAPSDKLSMWQVHPMFPGLMETNKLRDILFPVVLDHDIGFVPKYFPVVKNMQTSINSQLLELRLVSRSMRKAIDKWFDDDILRLFSPHVKPAYNSWNSYKNILHYSMTFDVATLQKLLDRETPTRMFKRNVIVDIPSSRVSKEIRVRCFNLFAARVTKALEDDGGQIWRFKLNCWDIDGLGVSREQVYTLLKEWLGLTPNVKFIDLNLNTHRCRSHYDPNVNFVWSQGFPTLHALKRLDLHTFFPHKERATLELMADAIISANPQIKMVNFNGYSDYQLMSRPSIKTLNLELCQLIIDASPVLFKRIETTLGNFNWNFKMLELNFSGIFVSINSLIRLLNLLPSLENVFINNYSVSFSNEEIPFLQLPNLTCFKISFVRAEGTDYDRNTHFFFSLQFMLQCRKLEFFHWSDNSSSRKSGRSLCRRIQAYEAEHPEEMLDFGGGFNDLTKSNLWDAFRNLQLIDVYINGMRINETFWKQESRGFL